MPLVRINKYLSMCGVTSRRGAEGMIAERRITVNDQTVEQLGLLVNTETDAVKVDGTAVEPVGDMVYVILNKPAKTMTTLHDPFKRRTILDYLEGLKQRVYPVGRLDYDTEGIILLTNDGEMAYRLAHPKYGVAKIYEAKVKGHFTPDNAQAIKRGVKLEDGAIGKGEVTILGFVGRMTRIRLTLTEGRKREVKQLCKGVGHPVEHLRRVEFAGMVLRNLKSGQWRQLTGREIGRLKELVGLE